MHHAKRPWLVLSVTSFLFLAQSASAATADFLGTWLNSHPRRGLWGKVVITQDSSGAIQLARFGACGFHGQEFCDDGVHTLTLYPAIDGTVDAGLSSGPSLTTGDVVFANRDLVLNLNTETGVLKVQTFTRFNPGDERGVYVHTDKFEKQ